MSAPKNIHVLVIGGCHTYGYGIEMGNGFVQRMAAEWERSGIHVKVDYFAPAKFRKVAELLKNNPTLPDKYDLILLQLGHFELIARSFKSLFRTNTDYNTGIYGKLGEAMEEGLKPTDIKKLHSVLPDSDEWLRKKDLVELKYRFWSVFKNNLLRIYSQVKQPAYLKEVRKQLLQIINSLEKYRSRILFIEPFPTADPLTNGLRKWGSKQLQQEAGRQGFGLLNVYELLNRNPDCLLSDGAHLNEMGHYLVWLRLHKWLRIHRFDLGRQREHSFNYQLHTN
jgi:hypothetical protein